MSEKESSTKQKEPIYKKWWFWLIVVILIIGMSGNTSNTSNNTLATKGKNENRIEKSEKENIEKNTSTNITENKKTETYTITGEEKGEYGKEVILNANTDMPTTKYLYKLPAGTYSVTTTNKKYSTFFIVKDEIVNTGTETYPEELDYVSEQYMLTAGNDDFKGKAKKNITVTLNEDESFLVMDKNTILFEKK